MQDAWPARSLNVPLGQGNGAPVPSSQYAPGGQSSGAATLAVRFDDVELTATPSSRQLFVNSLRLVTAAFALGLIYGYAVLFLNPRHIILQNESSEEWHWFPWWVSLTVPFGVSCRA